MSQTQTPPNRLVGTTGWKRHARILAIIMGFCGLAIIGVILLESRPPAKKEALVAATSIPSSYTPAPPPDIVQVASRPTPAPLRQAPVQAAAEAPKPPPAPSIAVTYFTRPDNQRPEYMKPKAAAKVAAADPTSGIDYKTDTFDGTTAFVLNHPELVLPQWTSIPCVLETGVITGVSGVNPFRCHTTRDVKSPTGVTLMETGTIIGGTYESLVAEGQTRIVAVTANARTPFNVVVPLGGPIADQIGAAGVEGTVDEHWWRRIGGALILSLLDAGVSLGQSALQNQGNGNNTLNFGNSFGQGGPFSQVAGALLNKEMSIPATITLKQGEAMTLWTTRWVDFSHVYALQKVNP